MICFPVRTLFSATGFLVCGPWDQVAATAPSPGVRARGREEELEDMVGTVGQTFLGLTVQCARCHHHKFDPIPQADYYRLRAAFDGVRFGDRPLTTGKGAPLAWAAVSSIPPPTHILTRGDVDKPGERVGAAGLSVIHTPSPDLGLALDVPEGQRRLRLAEWISDAAQSATGARPGESRLALALRPGHRADAERFRLQRRSAVASRIARLAGDGVFTPLTPTPSPLGGEGRKGFSSPLGGEGRKGLPSPQYSGERGWG